MPTQAAAAPEGSLVRRTWHALLEPKRLFPVLTLSATLLLAQGRSSHEPLALPLGLLMCVSFVLIAPVSWRVLFPAGIDLGHGGVRLVLYAAIGTGVVLSLTVAAPRVVGMGPTLLTLPATILVSWALFLVGGWGLGRDIDMTARLADVEARTIALARAAEHAQLLAMRSHLDPHFLFNTLNAIAEWCRQDPEVAEQAILQLSTMLRTILEGVLTPLWSVREEVNLLDTLFKLYELRDPKLFHVEKQLDSRLLDASIPPMLLLPLAENAMKYGRRAGQAGRVVLTVRRRADGGCEIVIRNPGAFRPSERGEGQGLAMVRRRLEATYGGKAFFAIAADKQETVATVGLPGSGHVPDV